MSSVSFLLRVTNLDSIQRYHLIIWPLMFWFPIIFFPNKPPGNWRPSISHFQEYFQKIKKHGGLGRSSRQKRERQLSQSSSICLHAIIRVFKRISGHLWGLFSAREQAGLEWNRPPIEKGGEDLWSHANWHLDPRHCWGLTKAPMPNKEQKKSRTLKKKRGEEGRIKEF